MNERTSAETIALQAMVWVLEDSDRTMAFLAATGATPSDLATSAGNPEFLGAVLDFLLSDDAYVTGFCDARGLPYATPMQMRAHLPGFSQMHWT